MGLVTPTTIAEIFGSGIAESLRLTGIVEDEDARYLGAVGLMKRQPVFRGILGFPWNGILSDDSRFLVRPMVKGSEGGDGVGARGCRRRVGSKERGWVRAGGRCGHPGSVRRPLGFVFGCRRMRAAYR